MLIATHAIGMSLKSVSAVLQQAVTEALYKRMHSNGPLGIIYLLLPFGAVCGGNIYTF
jgi:hypothetical protein